MKMTMHIDDTLLDRVITSYGCANKTEAVDLALREMDRKVRFREFVENGLGFAPDELAASVYPDYDPLTFRVADPVAYVK